jgi:hypothetical protein
VTKISNDSVFKFVVPECGLEEDGDPQVSYVIALRNSLILVQRYLFLGKFRNDF